LEFLYTVLRYVSQSGRNVTAAEIQQAVVTVFPEEGAVLLATAAEQWLERGRELGKQEGLLTAIELGLALKFGVMGLAFLPTIRHVQNVELLRTLAEGIKAAQRLAELRDLYAELMAEAQACALEGIGETVHRSCRPLQTAEL